MEEMICGKCGVALERQKTRLSYLGHEFFEQVPRCPCCGQIYISEELADGKLCEVEEALEEK